MKRQSEDAPGLLDRIGRAIESEASPGAGNDPLQRAAYELDRARMLAGLLGPQDWSGLAKVFIISTGRTGTKFLARFLNQFREVYATHEPYPDFLPMAIDYARGRVAEDVAVERMMRLRRALRRHTARRGARIYVESNNRLFSLIAPLRRAFGRIKVVHIVRDGRDYVRSGMSRVWYTDRDRAPRLRASYFPEDPCFADWDRMSRFEKICWRWQKKDGFIQAGLDALEDYISLKFEDIFKDPEHAGMRRMLDYIGLPAEAAERGLARMMDRKVNSTRSHAIAKWTEWDSGLIDSFERIAGAHMRRCYDYDWQGNPAAQRRSNRAPARN
jgi:hypothetical protein